MQVIALSLSEPIRAMLERALPSTNSLICVDNQASFLEKIKENKIEKQGLLFVENVKVEQLAFFNKKNINNFLVVPIINELKVNKVVTLLKNDIFDLLVKPFSEFEIRCILQKGLNFIEFIQANPIKKISVKRSSRLSWPHKKEEIVDMPNGNEESIDKKPRLFIVEDNPLIVAQYKLHLKEEWDIYNANTIKKAKNMIDERQFEALILDLFLPDGVSSEVMIEFQQKQPQMEVIIMTAYTELDLIKQTLELGAYDFCVKGADLTTFLIKMKHLLRLSKLKQVKLNKPKQLR